METPSFIKVKDTSYLFNEDGCFKFYVPEKFFTNKLAEFVGEYVSLFGIIPYAIFDKNDKLKGKLRSFKFPAMFLTKPDDIESIKNVKLTQTSKSQDYKVLKYYKDGMIVVNYLIAEDTSNLEKWYSALGTASLPNVIKYDELQDYFLENVLLTGNSYSVSLQLIGIVLSELCRSNKDPDKPFRLENNKNMNDYNWIPIRDVPKNISPFSAITSEEWDKAVIASITTDNNKQSPMEKIMMD